MELPPTDFESAASASSAIPANGWLFESEMAHFPIAVSQRKTYGHLIRVLPVSHSKTIPASGYAIELTFVIG